ncbi:glucokinase [Ferrimonas balearica DSM 9799]|uniref:Glucokinase n=1 Tax=Ferrimonas balearica (strain DSM 9799 / CCM 4581 / KCTC 23876 / PAT) TaxID=550540 RepID=E1SVG9_FERBD|nr:glucokinase [Ferrimonas balearica]ADN75315.1 glucokinase [Ferrimonas balearica DSM 9799]
MQKNELTLLVADIGGTNARFALAHCTGAGIEVSQARHFPSADFASLEAVARHYLDTLESAPALDGGCLAVAGPVAGERIALTNLNWYANVSELQRQLGLPRLAVINDFVAYAYSIPQLPDSQRQVVKPGEPMAGAPRVVLGPGTGFGVASLVPTERGWLAIPCEGGHISLAATNERQAALVEILRRRFPHVSVETVLCGRGLVNLYQAMGQLLNLPAPLTTPAEITSAAQGGQDLLARETLAEFCRWLGSVTADLVLAQGARGGACLGGGILPRIAEFLQHSDFTQAFGHKGLMTGYLEPVPVELALKSDTALMGAAAWFRDHG